MPKEVRVEVRFSADQHLALQQLAEDAGRSIAGFIRHMLAETHPQLRQSSSPNAPAMTPIQGVVDLGAFVPAGER